MASRKAKPPAKKRVPPDRPSSSMTIEVEALTSRTLGEMTDLAATVEIAVLGSAGPRVLIMDAAESIIADRGFNLTTSREVAALAGVSVDVFHGHFADMRALLIALCERLCAQATSAADDATETEAAIRGVVEVMLGRAALVRAVFLLNERGLIEELRRVGTYLRARVSRLLAKTKHPPEPYDIGFAVLLAMSIAHQAIVVGTEWAGVELDRERIAQRAAHAATAYLASTRHSP